MSYILNGKHIKYLNRLVLETVNQYIQNKKDITYSELKQIFKDDIQGSYGVIKNEEDLEKLKQQIIDVPKRFFMNKSEILYLQNGEKIYVCKGWGDDYTDSHGKYKRGNKKNFLELIKYLEYKLIINNEKENKKEVDEKTTQEKIDIKNIILYGPPGVGKTHNYQNLISMLEENKPQKEIFNSISNSLYVELDNDIFKNIKEEERVEFITFHQSYSYEDFIEGFRPSKDGKIERQDGIFKILCDEAEKNQEKNYYIVIDEINRGNISKIFGELITLIEEDKRDIYEATLPYSKTSFKVPSNLYIIATMNSTDKSIATIDIALRRRFTFLKMKPSLELVQNQSARYMMKKLNDYISEKLGEDYQLGHSYFMKVQNDEDLEFIKEYKIKPLLEEYFYADDKSADEILAEVFSNG